MFPYLLLSFSLISRRLPPALCLICALAIQFDNRFSVSQLRAQDSATEVNSLPPPTESVASAATGKQPRPSWEYAPYRVLLELALTDAAGRPLNNPVVDKIRPAIQTAVNDEWRGLWLPDWKAESAPASDKAAEPTTGDETKTLSAASAAAHDKLFKINVTQFSLSYFLEVGETDLNTRTSEQRVGHNVTTAEELPAAVAKLIKQLFTPLARVEQIDADKVVLRLRGAKLTTKPGELVAGRAFRLFERVRSAEGFLNLPEQGQVRPIDWTWLVPLRQDGALVTCQVVSAFPGALEIPETTPVEILALAARPLPLANQIAVTVSGKKTSAPIPGVRVVARRMAEPHDQVWSGKTGAEGTLRLPIPVQEAATTVENPLCQLEFYAGDVRLWQCPYLPGYQFLTANGSAPRYALPVTPEWVAQQTVLAEIRENLLQMAAVRRVAGQRIAAAQAAGNAAEVKLWQNYLAAMPPAALLYKMLPQPIPPDDDETETSALPAALHKQLLADIQEVRRAIQQFTGQAPRAAPRRPTAPKAPAADPNDADSSAQPTESHGEEN